MKYELIARNGQVLHRNLTKPQAEALKEMYIKAYPEEKEGMKVEEQY